MRRLAVGLSILIVTASLSSWARAQDEVSPVDLAFDGAVAAIRDKNYSAAVSTFRELAAHSHYDAQYNLALLLDRGLGTPEDFKEAFKWALLAKIGKVKRANKLVTSIQEKLSAESQLAVYEEVQSFIRARVEAGNRDAIMHYAYVQADILPEPNNNEAYIWYSIAAALGLPNSIAKREQTRELVLPEELEMLQAKANELFAKLPNPSSDAPSPDTHVEPNAAEPTPSSLEQTQPVHENDA